MDVNTIQHGIVGPIAQICSLFPINKLLHEELGTFGFLEYKEIFINIKELYSKIDNEKLRKAHDCILQDIQKIVLETKTIFDKIENFETRSDQNDQRGSDLKQSRNELITELWNCYKNCQNLIPYIITICGNLKKSTELEELATVKNQINNYKGELEGLLQGIRVASGKEGIAKEAVYFKEEADRHKRESYKWLGIAVLFSGLILAFLISIPFLGYSLRAYTQIDEFLIYNVITSKILIGLLLTYGLVQFVKNYNAHRHNTIVNRHRQNALCTYTAIMNATNDEKHKDAVLNHAAACIFAPQESGYNKAEANAGSLVEIKPKANISFSQATH